MGCSGRVVRSAPPIWGLGAQIAGKTHVLKERIYFSQKHCKKPCFWYVFLQNTGEFGTRATRILSALPPASAGASPICDSSLVCCFLACCSFCGRMLHVFMNVGAHASLIATSICADLRASCTVRISCSLNAIPQCMFLRVFVAIYNINARFNPNSLQNSSYFTRVV